MWWYGTCSIITICHCQQRGKVRQDKTIWLGAIQLIKWWNRLLLNWCCYSSVQLWEVLSILRDICVKIYVSKIPTWTGKPGKLQKYPKYWKTLGNLSVWKNGKPSFKTYYDVCYLGSFSSQFVQQFPKAALTCNDCKCFEGSNVYEDRTFFIFIVAPGAIFCMHYFERSYLILDEA